MACCKEGPIQAASTNAINSKLWCRFYVNLQPDGSSHQSPVDEQANVADDHAATANTDSSSNASQVCLVNQAPDF